jgi:hypothetical protein
MFMIMISRGFGTYIGAKMMIMMMIMISRGFWYVHRCQNDDYDDDYDISGVLVRT